MTCVYEDEKNFTRNKVSNGASALFQCDKNEWDPVNGWDSREVGRFSVRVHRDCGICSSPCRQRVDNKPYGTTSGKFQRSRSALDRFSRFRIQDSCSGQRKRKKINVILVILTLLHYALLLAVALETFCSSSAAKQLVKWNSSLR